MSLTDDLNTLSEAHGPKALAAAFSVLQGAVRQARRQAKKTLGPLAETYQAAMRIWDTQKADGVSVADRQRDLEKTLRMAWPQIRPWVYFCDRCSDTGWEHRVCREGARCGRPFKLPGQRADDFTGQGKCGETHDYVVPCWCEKGRLKRAALMNEPPQGDPKDFAAAGKSKPTRIGR